MNTTMLIVAVLIPFLATSLLPVLLVRRRRVLWCIAITGLGLVEFAVFAAVQPLLTAAAGAAMLAAVMAVGSAWIARIGRRRGSFPTE